MPELLQPESPAWWLHRLAGQLAIDTPRMVLMDRYYRGEHPLPYVPRQLKAEFKVMLARSRSNFMRVVIDAPAERLRVQGFRARGSEKADDAAWDRWLTSQMEVDANLSISDSLVKGRSYLSVWRFEGEDKARIQVEEPGTTVVEHDKSDRRRRAAGLRLWLDDWTGKIRADVHLPDAIYSYEARAPMCASKVWPQTWQPAYQLDEAHMVFADLVGREEPIATPTEWIHHLWTELDVTENTIGEVSIIPIVNRPSVVKQPDGESEISDVYLTQDRINEMLFNRGLAAWTTAYRQKWATGLDVPVDDQGTPIEPFKAAVDRLWVSESELTKFGEFGQTDLKPFIESVEQDIQHVAVQTRTPRHYFVQQGQSPSGDSIKSAEAGLVAKVLDKQAAFGRAFAEAQRLAQVFESTAPTHLETIWADPEYRTLGELTDAVIKEYQSGLIARRVANEKLGMSPTEIARNERLLATEALLQDAAGALEAATAPAELVEVP